MARHRGESGAGMGDGLADAAQDRLDEAVTELERLTKDQLLQVLERLIDVDYIHTDSSVSVDSVRRLYGWSPEGLRVAAELEAAARCCRLIELELRRLIEQELRQQIDLLLASSDRQLDALIHRAAGPVGKSYLRGLAGVLKAIPQRRNSAQEQPAGDSATALPSARNRRPVTSSRSLVTPDRTSEADIAALLLGPLELNVAGRHVVRWNSLKARGVFQYLLMHHDRPVRRDVLMELQWPSHTPTSARNNLNVALYSLRNTLGGPQDIQPVLYQDGCYLLNPLLRWRIDRDEFLCALQQAHLSRRSSRTREAMSHYQKAVGLYRGPLFEDDVTGDWYLPEQRHLNELYVEALVSLGELYFDLEELTSAVWFGQQALTSDPSCEPAHRLLMRCYAQEHKQQLVSRQYRLCVDALRDELGVAPGAETLRLFHDLTKTPY
jgi:DNA-binding SARP family transcriptional activator